MRPHYRKKSMYIGSVVGRIMTPQKTYSHLNFRTCECDLTWKKGFCRYYDIKDLEVRSSWIIWMALHLTSVLIRDRRGDITQRRRPCEDVSRVWIYTATSSGMPGATRPGMGVRGYSSKGFPESSALLTPVFLF